MRAAGSTRSPVAIDGSIESSIDRAGRGGAAVEADATRSGTGTTRRVQIACFARSVAIFASS
ncbi:hypothetical protein WR30_10115 [Burkholderia contaminans FFH2055]|nr:hypothetical protein WR30_10115 [Burkholderia contaminans FFH2055]